MARSILVAFIEFHTRNIFETDAIGIAVTGMVIVFVALALLSLFIAMLPRILKVISKQLPEPEGIHTHPPSSVDSRTDPDEDDVLAAIGFVLRLRDQNQRKRG